jgi:hypothetical protein
LSSPGGGIGLGVLPVAELHLLLVGEGHPLGTVRDRSFLAVRLHEQQDADNRRSDFAPFSGGSVRALVEVAEAVQARNRRRAPRPNSAGSAWSLSGVPRQESNLRTRFRKPLVGRVQLGPNRLYLLSDRSMLGKPSSSDRGVLRTSRQSA